MKLTKLVLTLAISSVLFGCSSDDDTPAPVPTPSTPTVVDTDNDTIADADDNCVNDANTDQKDSDVNGQGDACDALPTTYTFDSKFAAATSAVSYTGQTARQMLIEAVTAQAKTYTSDDVTKTPADIVNELNFYFDAQAAIDTQPITFTKSGVTLLPATGATPTFGDISSGKNLKGKIAGNDTGVDAGALEDGLVNGEFFGWKETAPAHATLNAFEATGVAAARPEDFVNHLFNLLAIEATDGVVPQIPVTTGGPSVALDVAYVDAHGRNFRQLIQKFLLGSVTFAQGTSDYLQTDFSAKNEQDGAKPFTSAGHDWDEAFGYFGGARDYNDYTDDEIAGKSGRDAYKNGYFDSNADGSIDLRSEINLANSTNCAKRDRGTSSNTNPTNFTKTVFDAFLTGRAILNNAEQAVVDAGAQVDLTADQISALDTVAKTAASTWEQCIAATVVHYINDVNGDIGKFAGGNYEDLGHYKNLAKHWSEMKGFAMGLQFNVNSPIYDSADNTTKYRDLLSAMGTGPVLASASTADISAYLLGLTTARDSLQTIYGFDAENVTNW